MQQRVHDVLTGFLGALVDRPHARGTFLGLGDSPPEFTVRLEELHLVPQPLNLASLRGDEVQQCLRGVKVLVRCAETACDAGEFLLSRLRLAASLARLLEPP